MVAGPLPSSHRADIQGLRGIAVLLVVLFHAEVGVSGGFIGVDVFFVVSGYVITQLLVRELDGSGTVRLRDFYTRRARRLLPALAVMSAVVLVLAMLLMSPNGPQQFAARTSMAADVFVANIYLYRYLGNYFAQAADGNPFLHLWTLSVEEQFYLVLPATLMVVWRALRRRSRSSRIRALAVVIGAISLVSFAANVVMIDLDRTLVWITDPLRFAFYLTPTRLWEFGVGVLLALAPGLVERVDGRAAAVAAAVGGGLVLWASFAFDAATPFPGVAALAPVIGAALLLIGGARSVGAGRALGVRPLTWIGDRSYSWYLWHWPLIVFAGLLWPDNDAALVIAAAVSLLPAWAAYEWVEDPIRRNRGIRGPRVVQLAGACVVVPAILAVSLGLGARHGWWDDDLVAVSQRSQARHAGCYTEDFQPVAWPGEPCIFRVANARGTMLLVGDSHAIAASDGVAEAAHRLGYDLAVWSRASCPVVVDPPTDRARCRQFIDETLALVDDLEPDVVVLGMKTGNHVANEPDGSRGWEQHLGAMVDDLADRGAATLVLGDVPEYPYDATATVSMLRPHGSPPTIDRAELETEREPITAAEAEATSGANAAVFDPIPSMCTTTCSPVDGDRWLYYDAHHLTPAGSLLLVDRLTEALRALTAEAVDS